MNDDTREPNLHARARSASDRTIVLACRNTDATNALIRGAVQCSGMPLRIVENNNVVAMFAGMVKGEYDVSEMSLAEFIYYRSRGAADFIGIPVFPSRVFRHGYIYCNQDAYVSSPELLSGKSIGFLRWVQTAFVWVRGTLVEDYGISRHDTKWYVNSMHHWKDSDEEDVRPRDGSTIRVLEERAGMSEYERLCSALFEGELDAIAVTENAQYLDLLARNKKAHKLFPVPRLEEAAYFKRTGIYPIMHLLVVREDTLARHPGLGEQLFDLFVRSKQLGMEWTRSTPSLTLAWKDEYLRKEREVLGANPCVFGLNENEHTLHTFLRYCYDQGISATDMDVRDLFAHETWDLSERGIET
jgi:4,5-dihydroxyphthalate decarboxylase